MYSLDFVHPISKECVPLFSDYVYKLLDKGFSIHDIMLLSKEINPKYNRNNLFNNDLLYNYMLHLEIKDMKALCLIDKQSFVLWNNQQFWKDKIIKDHRISINLLSLFSLKKYNLSVYKTVATDMNVIHKAKNASMVNGKGFRFKNEDLASVLSFMPAFIPEYKKNIFVKQVILFYQNKIKIYLCDNMEETDIKVYIITVNKYHIYEMLIKIYTLYQKEFKSDIGLIYDISIF